MEEKIIAVVAGKEVTEAEFAQFVERIPQDQQAMVSTPEGRHQALAQYTNYFLFEKVGQDRGFDQSEEFKEMLEGVKRELLAQYTLTQIVKDVKATEDELRTYYDEHIDLFKTGAKAEAKHILVATEEECLDAKAKIEAGEKTFEQMAQEVSTCPSSAQGGSLGAFGRGQMVPEFDQAVFEGEVGKVIGPVKTQFGYHLIWIDSLNDGGVMPFESVAPQIEAQIVANKQNDLYMKERAEMIEKYGLEFK